MTLDRTGRSMKNFEIMDRSYLAGAGGVSIFFTCGSTFWPGIARSSPAVTTRSSGFRPLSITRRLALAAARSRTLRCSTTFSPFTTST